MTMIQILSINKQALTFLKIKDNIDVTLIFLLTLHRGNLKSFFSQKLSRNIVTLMDQGRFSNKHSRTIVASMSETTILKISYAAPIKIL